MLDKFIQAALPEPVTCLGVRLKPFSLGHWLWLNRLKIPYVTHESGVHLDELILAVIVCCQSYSENWECFSGRDKTVAQSIKQFKRNIMGAWYRRPVTIKGRKVFPALFKEKDFNFFQPATIFAKYIADAFILPTIATKENNTPSVAPWELMTLTTCLKLQGSCEEVLNQPVGLSRWLVAGFCESEGIGQLVDSKALQEDIKAANEFAEKLRQEGKMK